MGKINFSEVVKSQKNKDGDNELRLLERHYVLNHFKEYIKRNSDYKYDDMSLRVYRPPINWTKI